MKTFLLIVFFVAQNALAIDLAKTFNFEGALKNDPSGTPMVGPVSLTIQIYNPASTCLIFEETHSSVALDVDGLFAIKVGSGTRAAAGTDGGLIWKNIFQNDTTVRTPGTGCASGYTPAAYDARNVRVTVNGNIILSPDFSLQPVPMATVAESLQGKIPTDFVSTGGGSLVNGAFMMTNQSEIKFSNASTNYVSLRAPTPLGSNTILTLPNSAGTNGQVLSTDGSGNMSWTTPASAVSTLNGLAGGAQTFAAGASGTAPNWSSSGAVHTLNIPLASTASVTAGLLSNTDHTTFNSKQAALGFTPVNKAGDTMTGALVLSGNPSAANDAANKQYVDTMLPKTGGTMTGSIITPAGSTGTPAIGVGAAGSGIFSPAASQIAFSLSGTEKMRITNSGVGIGTAAPVADLDVPGTVRLGDGTNPNVTIGSPSAMPMKEISSATGVTFSGVTNPAPAGNTTGTWAPGGSLGSLSAADTIICSPASTPAFNILWNCFYNGTNVVISILCNQGTTCTGVTGQTWRVTVIKW